MSASGTGHTVLFSLALCLTSATPFVGCSGPGEGTVQSVRPGEESTGTVGLQLTLPGGEEIGTIAYTIEGPRTYADVEDVSGTASTFGFVIPDVAPGAGYTITLKATTPDGAVTCEGTSSAFSVAGNQTTAVNVFLACTTTSEAGAVLVNATGFDCATWHTAIASPAAVATGGTVALAGWASGPDPGAVTYQWSAPTGTLTNATSANATFACPPTPGPVTITLTVGDGEVPQGATCPAASSTTTLEVSCEAPASLRSTCWAQPGFFFPGSCDSATSGTMAGFLGEQGSVRLEFTITNQGTSATGPLDVSVQGSGLFVNCPDVLAGGASCTVSTDGCWETGTRSGTATISDPKSGASVTVTAQTTCWCRTHGIRCDGDWECCIGYPGRPGVCTPIMGCG